MSQPSDLINKSFHADRFAACELGVGLVRICQPHATDGQAAEHKNHKKR